MPWRFVASGLIRSASMFRSGCFEPVWMSIRAHEFKPTYWLCHSPDAFVEGVWASASLLHLSKPDFENALQETIRVLGTSGRITLMMKKGDGASWETDRYQKPRWFQYWSAVELDKALVDAGYRIDASEEWSATSNTWLIRQCVAVA